MEGKNLSENRSSEKFKVSRKPDFREEKSVNMTLRIEKKLQKQYEDWANKTNRSRNELMCMALAYALKNIEFIDEE